MAGRPHHGEEETPHGRRCRLYLAAPVQPLDGSPERPGGLDGAERELLPGGGGGGVEGPVRKPSCCSTPMAASTASITSCRHAARA